MGRHIKALVSPGGLSIEKYFPAFKAVKLSLILSLMHCLRYCHHKIRRYNMYPAFKALRNNQTEEFFKTIISGICQKKSIKKWI